MPLLSSLPAVTLYSKKSTKKMNMTSRVLDFLIPSYLFYNLKADKDVSVFHLKELTKDLEAEETKFISIYGKTYKQVTEATDKKLKLYSFGHMNKKFKFEWLESLLNVERHNFDDSHNKIFIKLTEKVKATKNKIKSIIVSY